jgi:molecular chaperone GrpE
MPKKETRHSRHGQGAHDAEQRREGREEDPTAAAPGPGATAEATPAEPAAPADGPAPTDDAVAQAGARATEMEDRWKRSAAEFINYKRRAEQERGDLLRFANRGLILDLLPVLDDLERALVSVPPEEAGSKWVEGVRLVERKFRQVLERQGVTPIDAVGQPFDPNLHEAVGGSGTVVAQEYQRGYKLHDRVLRPSMVLVGEPETAEVRC